MVEVMLQNVVVPVSPVAVDVARVWGRSVRCWICFGMLGGPVSSTRYVLPEVFVAVVAVALVLLRFFRAEIH